MQDDRRNPYQRLYKEPLTEERLKAMRDDVRDFFMLLIEMDREQRLLPSNEIQDDH